MYNATEKPIEVFTDGASQGNPGPGGWAAILRYGGHVKEMSGGFKKTTNNRMELLAVIEALEAIKKPGALVHVYSDSQYVVKAVNEGWVFGWEKKAYKDKKNPDLWQRFLKVYRLFNVKFFWVKGHAGHPENEKCDVLAVSASKNATKQDIGFVESL